MFLDWADSISNSSDVGRVSAFGEGCNGFAIRNNFSVAVLLKNILNVFVGGSCSRPLGC